MEFFVSFEEQITTFWILIFIIFSFYYVIKTIIFEFISFTQLFNDKHNKLNEDLLVFGEIDTIQKKMLCYTLLFIMYVIL